MSRRSNLLLIAVLALPSCKTRLWDLDADGGLPAADLAVDASPAPDLTPTTSTATASCRQDNPSNKVDVLFVIDSSRSMEAMQAELHDRFPQFLEVFAALARVGTYVDLHIGVVTTDLGAGSGDRGCTRAIGGEAAILQRVGKGAAAGCQGPMGPPWIEYDTQPGGKHNLAPGKTLTGTFGCMASVGARGCGHEHPLEAARMALAGTVPDNRGFVRDDALLTVVFLANEDDCSAPPGTDLFDANKGGMYGRSIRCTRYGVMCGNPPRPLLYEASKGKLAGCVPMPNPNGAGPGKLYDVARYIDFFTKPRALGGIKRNPFDVVLLDISAPPEPFEIILAYDQDTDHAFLTCDMLDETCLPTLQRSCQNQKRPCFYGDPAVRLRAVVNSAFHHKSESICADSYSPAMEHLAKLVVAQLGECCIPERLTPDEECEVDEVTQHEDGRATVRKIPRCAPGSGTPCWRLAVKDKCAGRSPDGLGVAVERGGTPAPDHTTTRATCVVVGK